MNSITNKKNSSLLSQLQYINLKQLQKKIFSELLFHFLKKQEPRFKS
ncbi:unnamed protein product [Paramecium sonneborni]|uniref:Uncharacterized protein n=1 Tax=Paramecium sonneborni TaxID=65129 RepID=A0A8S1PUE8_9CILI|nr:unnamed protein product [Paramecium sonneborni]